MSQTNPNEELKEYYDSQYANRIIPGLQKKLESKTKRIAELEEALKEISEIKPSRFNGETVTTINPDMDSVWQVLAKKVIAAREGK